LVQVRLVTLIVSASVLWLLASQGPGIEDVKDEFFHAHDSLLDYMVGGGAGNQQSTGCWRDWWCAASRAVGFKLGL